MRKGKATEGLVQQRVYFIWAENCLGSSPLLLALYRVDRTSFQSPKQNKHAKRYGQP